MVVPRGTVNLDEEAEEKEAAVELDVEMPGGLAWEAVEEEDTKAELAFVLDELSRGRTGDNSTMMSAVS